MDFWKKILFGFLNNTKKIMIDAIGQAHDLKDTK